MNNELLKRYMVASGYVNNQTDEEWETLTKAVVALNPKIARAVNAYDGLIEQHGRDSQTLNEYAAEKSKLRGIVRGQVARHMRDQEIIKELVSVLKLSLSLFKEMDSAWESGDGEIEPIPTIEAAIRKAEDVR